MVETNDQSPRITTPNRLREQTRLRVYRYATSPILVLPPRARKRRPGRIFALHRCYQEVCNLLPRNRVHRLCFQHGSRLPITLQHLRFRQTRFYTKVEDRYIQYISYEKAPNQNSEYQGSLGYCGNHDNTEIHADKASLARKIGTTLQYRGNLTHHLLNLPEKYNLRASPDTRPLAAACL